MTWVLRVMVPMVHTPRGRSGATFVKVLAQSEFGQFCHFDICGPTWDRHHARWYADLSEQRAWESQLDSRHMAYGMPDPICKPAWRYTIGSTPDFGSFGAAKMTPFWDPNFPLPCGQLAAPFLYAHREPRPPFQVVHSDRNPRSCLLPCEPLALPWPGGPRVGMTPILVILAS